MWQEIEKVWGYHLWVIDGQVVTLGKVIFSIVIFVVGIIVAGFAVRILTRRLARVAKLKESTTSIVEKVLRYSMIVMVALFAMRIVNIPLGAFAFLGGAIAIGVGFGAQNLINNFISGFILMTERPIHIGDLVEVGDVVGRVEEIGGRCTKVRTGENIHILVPNSSFLEKNIVNWTLADHEIRTKVTAGVIYGSPTRQVEELLLRAINENPQVTHKDDGFVIFRDFGDNALIFDLYFWITVTTVLARRRIESEIRFRIDALFREAGIVIAFPQRDVHLDTSSPLLVQLEKQPDA
ncbi:MAG: mechanosensitive ion channel [Deltaproteobacteria bacterium]|nr:mechanosensitive ion channel [Deltaproteobacteria bacterium]